MSVALRRQGWLFVAIAILVVAVQALAPVGDRHLQLAVLGGLVVLLGAPHGALDPVYVKDYVGPKGWTGWLLFSLAYLTLSLCVVAVWKLWPLAFAAGFLLFSALHFSSDPLKGVSIAARLIYGASVLALPALLHRQEVGEIFALLIGSADAHVVATVLAALAPPLAVAVAVMVALEWPRNRMAALEIAVACALMALATPLVAFAVFFCAMHSPRHWLRTLDENPGITLTLALKTAVAPSLVVALVAGIGLWFSPPGLVDMRIAQWVFVGLAALTLPHMLVVDRRRLGSIGLARGTKGRVEVPALATDAN